MRCTHIEKLLGQRAFRIAYDSNEGIIKHFRVDKMLYIKSNGKGREGRQAFSGVDHRSWRGGNTCRTAKCG